MRTQKLEDFNSAFAFLGTNWQGISVTQRRTLVHIVADAEEDGNVGKFLDSKTFQKEVMPLFHGFDSERILACLNEIRDIRRERS